MKRFLPVDLDNCSVMSRDEVRAVDAWAIGSVGVSGVVLMENAGSGCADIIAERLGGAMGKRVCVFCGGGNNGGDGYVIARHLHNAGGIVKVVICADRDKIKGDALENLRIIEKMKLDIEIGVPAGEGVARVAAGCDMVVDALLGTGLAGQLRDNYIELIESINSLDAEIIAVDIPSGLDCDKGVPLGAAIRAAATVTFVAVKKGFTEKNAKEFTGDVYVVSIGIEPGRSN
ncbi:MAG: NAD(P)H-hydrate epimerase [Phycisphaerae bacterium]|nr:NAD(P)H-hydrate epimerase [Phycisphaerae bacterium]